MRFLTADEAAQAIREMNRDLLAKQQREEIAEVYAKAKKTTVERQQHIKRVHDRIDSLLLDLKQKRAENLIHEGGPIITKPEPQKKSSAQSTQAPAPKGERKSRGMRSDKGKKHAKKVPKEICRSITATDGTELQEGSYTINFNFDVSKLIEPSNPREWGRMPLRVDSHERTVVLLEPPKPWPKAAFAVGGEYVALFRLRKKLCFRVFVCTQRATMAGKVLISLVPRDAMEEHFLLALCAEVQELNGSEFALCKGRGLMPWRIFAALSVKHMPIQADSEV